jgi:hypothetical protein
LANRAIIRRILHPNRNKGFYGVFRYRTENREEKRRLNWVILGLRGLHYSGILGKLNSGFSMVLGDDQITGHEMTLTEGASIDPKKVPNGNRGIIQAYSILHQIPVTGLIGALLITSFQIIDIRA